MRRLHLLHHFLNEKHWYAVTPPTLVIDWLMGSKGKSGETARTDTCRFLGLKPEHDWVDRSRIRFAGRSSGDLACSRLWLSVSHKKGKANVSEM
jgi:hypothetical protein